MEITLEEIQDWLKEHFLEKMSNPIQKAQIEEMKPDEAYWSGLSEGVINILLMCNFKIKGIDNEQIQS